MKKDSRKSFMEWLDFAEQLSMVGLLSLLVIVVFIQVFSRFVLNIPVDWSEEMARFLFIWFCWVGYSFAVRDFFHIRITAQFRIIPESLAKCIVVFGDVVWITFNLFAIYGAFYYLKSILAFPFIAIITRFSMFWIFMPIPTMLMLCTLRLIVNFFDRHYFSRSWGRYEESEDERKLDTKASEVTAP